MQRHTKLKTMEQSQKTCYSVRHNMLVSSLRYLSTSLRMSVGILFPLLISTSSLATVSVHPRISTPTNILQQNNLSSEQGIDTPERSWRSHWRCSAMSSNGTLYLVDDLDAQRSLFDIAVYTDAESISQNIFPDAKYIGTITVNASLQAGVISGQMLLNGQNLEVAALGRTPNFIVQNSQGVIAIGRCLPLFELATPAERAGIRQCLAFARSLSLSRGWGPAASEVDRFACEQDYEQHIKTLKARDSYL